MRCDLVECNRAGLLLSNTGPKAWNTLFPITCANSTRQSPVDIQLSGTSQDSELTANAGFKFSVLPPNTTLKIENDGVKGTSHESLLIVKWY